MDRAIICIDLKTFYASVECVERNLDPFNTNLVVADPDRGKGTVCLAVSPRFISRIVMISQTAGYMPNSNIINSGCMQDSLCNLSSSQIAHTAVFGIFVKCTFHSC